MYDNLPVKAVMDGEPTYEKMNEGKHGLGYWQGENAWNQLMHGGTMGVVYGAVCLWMWKITPDETGWEEWTNAPYSWQDALAFEGSTYAGMISKAFAGYDFADMERRWDLNTAHIPMLAKDGKFYVTYLSSGGKITIPGYPKGLPYSWFNPLNGTFQVQGQIQESNTFSAPDTLQPWVFIAGEKGKP